MNKNYKKLIILFLILVIIKFSLSLFVLSPSAYSDEYAYLKMSQSFLKDFSFSENGVPYMQFPPLYPIIISIANIFNDTNIIYIIIKLINCLISSLIIFPIFFLAKKFIEKKQAFKISLISSLLPISFSFSPFIMSENLFMPLFITTVYLMYLSFSENKLKWDILTGIFIGLTILTKIQGIIFIPIIIILIIYRLIKEKSINPIKKSIILGLSTIFIILPWMIRNFMIFGFSKSILIGSYNQYIGKGVGDHIISLVGLGILYLAYLIISTLIIFPVLFSNFIIKGKDNLIKIILGFLIFFSLLMGALHSASLYSLFNYSRILGRYIEILTPLIITFGYIGLMNLDKTKFKKITLIIGGVSIISIFFLMKDILMPINNLSLSWMGLINFIIENTFNIKLITYIIISFVLLVSIYLIYKSKEINYKKLMVSLFIFIIIAMMNTSIIIYNANTYWYKDDATQLGIWFNDYNKGESKILFDIEDECKIEKNKNCLYEQFKNGEISSVTGFWLKNEIILGDPKNSTNVDYIFSTKNLNLNKIKTFGKFKIYKTEGI